MSKRTILGVLQTNRVKTAPDIQEVFTEFGCLIKTRIGLHEVHNSACSPSGLILLELIGDESQTNAMEEKLLSFEGVIVKKMTFSEFID